MESDGFTLVTKRSRRKVHRPKHVSKESRAEASQQKQLGSLKPTLAEGPNRAEYISSQVLKHMKTPEIERLVRMITSGLPTTFACRKILSLVLLLQRYFGEVEVEVYDPVHTSEDKGVLLKLGCSLGVDNARGKKPSLCRSGSTLFVLPHCSMRLYSNLLWGLWDADLLANIALVGNSFKSYESRLFGIKATKDKTNCMSLLTGYTTEVVLSSGLNNRSTLYNAFSDTSLVIFPREKLREAEATGLFVDKPSEFLGELDC